MRKVVYLAGNISSDPETYTWRDRAIKLLRGYRVLNPAGNPFNKKLIKYYDGKSEEFLKSAIKQSQGILIVKDFNLVKNSDIILVNLGLITPEKPPLGTVYELAWAWYLKKPVVAIVGDNLYCKHPFTVATFSATAENLEDACKVIKEFFEER